MAYTVIRGVIGADAHTIGTTILGYALDEAGFKTVSLGVMVSQQEFVDAAKESNASAILVYCLVNDFTICRLVEDSLNRANAIVNPIARHMTSILTVRHGSSGL